MEWKLTCEDASQELDGMLRGWRHHRKRLAYASYLGLTWGSWPAHVRPSNHEHPPASGRSLSGQILRGQAREGTPGAQSDHHGAGHRNAGQDLLPHPARHRRSNSRRPHGSARAQHLNRLGDRAREAEAREVHRLEPAPLAALALAIIPKGEVTFPFHEEKDEIWAPCSRLDRRFVGRRVCAGWPCWSWCRGPFRRFQRVVEECRSHAVRPGPLKEGAVGEH